MTEVLNPTTSHVQYEKYDDGGSFVGLGNVDFFDTAATVAILDSLPVETVATYSDTSTDEGDDFFYAASNVGLADNKEDDSFTVHIPAFKDPARLEAYLAGRAVRSIPTEGDDTELNRLSTLTKVETLNKAVEALRGDPNIVLWFSTDDSWGGAHDLTFRLSSDLTQEERDKWEMD